MVGTELKQVKYVVSLKMLVFFPFFRYRNRFKVAIELFPRLHKVSEGQK